MKYLVGRRDHIYEHADQLPRSDRQHHCIQSIDRCLPAEMVYLLAGVREYNSQLSMVDLCLLLAAGPV
jgi:hypothetical protein